MHTENSMKFMRCATCLRLMTCSQTLLNVTRVSPSKLNNIDKQQYNNQQQAQLHNAYKHILDE